MPDIEPEDTPPDPGAPDLAAGTVKAPEMNPYQPAPGQGLHTPVRISRDPNDPFAPDNLARHELTAEQVLMAFANLKSVARNPFGDATWPRIRGPLTAAADSFRDLCRLARARFRTFRTEFEEAKKLPPGPDRINTIEAAYSGLLAAWNDWNKSWKMLGRLIVTESLARDADAGLKPPPCP